MATDEGRGGGGISLIGEGRLFGALKKREKLAVALVESMAGGATATRKSGAREREREAALQSIVSGARERDRDFDRARQSIESLRKEKRSDDAFERARGKVTHSGCSSSAAAGDALLLLLVVPLFVLLRLPLSSSAASCFSSSTSPRCSNCCGRALAAPPESLLSLPVALPPNLPGVPFAVEVDAKGCTVSLSSFASLCSSIAASRALCVRSSSVPGLGA